MFFLDIKTIVLGYMISNIMLAFVVYRLWIQNKHQFNGTTFWVVDFVLQALGTTLSIMRGIFPDFISIVASNFCMITGAVLFLFGLSQFTETKIKKIPNYILLILFPIIYYYFGIINPLVPARIAVFSTSFIFVSLQIVWLLFWKVSTDFRNTTRNTGIVFILFIILYIFRIISSFIDPVNDNYFISNSKDAIYVLFSQMLTILLTFSLILMINKRLFLEINHCSSEREKILHELSYLATMDWLTNIFNRMKMEEIMTSEITRFQSYGHPLSIILVDVDHFKSVNDTYGHMIGDTVLKSIALLLKNNTREIDFIGRWGGEEFLIITPETTLENSYSIADKLVKTISDHHFMNVGKVTVSIGVASLNAGESINDILKNADTALYKAKANGRNRAEL